MDVGRVLISLRDGIWKERKRREGGGIGLKIIDPVRNSHDVVHTLGTFASRRRPDIVGLARAA